LSAQGCFKIGDRIFVEHKRLATGDPHHCSKYHAVKMLSDWQLAQGAAVSSPPPLGTSIAHFMIDALPEESMFDGETVTCTKNAADKRPPFLVCAGLLPNLAQRFFVELSINSELPCARALLPCCSRINPGPDAIS
jgi:hypothetical protein